MILANILVQRETLRRTCRPADDEATSFGVVIRNTISAASVQTRSPCSGFNAHQLAACVFWSRCCACACVGREEHTVAGFTGRPADVTDRCCWPMSLASTNNKSCLNLVHVRDLNHLTPLHRTLARKLERLLLLE